MDVLADAKRVLVALTTIEGEKGRQPIDGASLIGPTALTADRINDAIELLEANNCFREVLRTNGTAPFAFLTVELNARGRQEAHDIQHPTDAEVALPQPTLSPPPLEFVRNPTLRGIVHRDWQEIQKCLTSQAWKATIIMAGSTIECLLLDAIWANQARLGTPRGDEGSWQLDDMLRFGAKHRWLSDVAQTLSDFARQYRNLVHPLREIREPKVVDRHEAVIASQIVETVIRDLSKLMQTDPSP